MLLRDRYFYRGMFGDVGKVLVMLSLNQRMIAASSPTQDVSIDSVRPATNQDRGLPKATQVAPIAIRANTPPATLEEQLYIDSLILYSEINHLNEHVPLAYRHTPEIQVPIVDLPPTLPDTAQPLSLDRITQSCTYIISLCQSDF